MKITLILFLFVSMTAMADDKKVDMRQGTKAVDEKYLEDLEGRKTPERETISHDNRPGDRSQQMESKKSRQYQEARPEELTPEEALKRQR